MAFYTNFETEFFHTVFTRRSVLKGTLRRDHKVIFVKSPISSPIVMPICLQTWSVWLPNCWALCTGVATLFSPDAKLITCSQVVWALWRGKVSALVVLQVLATQAYGIKLAFAMCLLQCLHCTDEAHIGRNRGTLSAKIENTVIAEIFVRVKISYSSACRLPCARNFRTATVVSDTLVYVYGFRMLLNFVLSAKSTKYTKLNRVWKFVRLQYIFFERRSRKRDLTLRW